MTASERALLRCSSLWLPLCRLSLPHHLSSLRHQNHESSESQQRQSKVKKQRSVAALVAHASSYTRVQVGDVLCECSVPIAPKVALLR